VGAVKTARAQMHDRRQQSITVVPGCQHLFRMWRLPNKAARLRGRKIGHGTL
jgi:hypothetical protein